MKRYRNWIIALVLSATAGAIALQNQLVPESVDATETPTNTSTPAIIFTDTPTITPAYEGCAYMWAYRDAPELTEKLDSTFRAIDPVINARAELFGEECVYADGHSTFGVMETDFYVHISVDELTNEENLGNWMAQVLPFIAQLPREEIQGNYGFVEFWFEKTEMDHVIVRVPVQLYINNARDVTGTALFQMFHNFP